MIDEALAQTISGLTRDGGARVGVCAQTLDGNHRLAMAADAIYPTASSVKLFVLYTLLARAERGEFSLADRLELDSNQAQPGSGVLFHLDGGLRPTLKDLATLMMMISDNTALILLQNHLGIDSVNREIKRLGLTQTRYGDWRRFAREYADSMKFGTASPQDFTDFLLRMFRGELLAATSTALFWDIMRIQKYIEPLRRHLPVSPWSREFGLPESNWVASKGGLLDDCACESGLVRVRDGGWVISIMIADLPLIGKQPEIGENLISNISQRVFETWGPYYDGGTST